MCIKTLLIIISTLVLVSANCNSRYMVKDVTITPPHGSQPIEFTESFVFTASQVISCDDPRLSNLVNTLYHESTIGIKAEMDQCKCQSKRYGASDIYVSHTITAFETTKCLIVVSVNAFDVFCNRA